MSEASLHVNEPAGRRIVPLDKPIFVIGRRRGVDLQLSNADVSREHAEIAREGDRFFIRDRGSTYGTFVNGQQVAEHALEHGDRIRCGRTDLEIHFVTEGVEPESSLRDAASDGTDLRQMAAVMNGLRALGSGRVLDEVLTLVMDSAIEVTKAERGFVMLANSASELELKIARGRGRTPLSGQAIAATSEKIPKDVFKTGQSQIVADLMEGNLADIHGGTIAVGIRHVLCVPLCVTPMAAPGRSAVGQRVIGVLYLDGRERGTLLSQATIGSLEAFATQAALAIESARLYADSAEKARIERDLRIAAEIQRALLPEPVYEGRVIDLAAASVPCRTVGGDFYDYVEVTAGAIGFGLGDVAGKGPPAALLAAAVQTNFAAQAPVSQDPADTMARINRALLRRAIDSRFATMFYGSVTNDGVLSYCNAGQDPPLVIHRDGLEWLETGGPVLGLLAVATYDFATVKLSPGDLIVISSDGVSEARNVAGDEFGRDRFVDAVRTLHGERPEAVLERLMSEVNRFAQGAAQADDITAMVVRYRGN
jgi:serine phosphatase RsbU (regulator of sigma subunit)